MTAENSNGSAPAVVGRPFQPGQSGNPGGRPKDSLTALLRQRLRDDEDTADKLVEELINLSLHGKEQTRVRALELVMDRLEGRPRQTLDMGRDDSPMQHLLARIADSLAALEQAREDD